MDSLQGQVLVPLSALAASEREGGLQPEVLLSFYRLLHRFIFIVLLLLLLIYTLLLLLPAVLLSILLLHYFNTTNL